jgi:putative membrane protein
MSHVTFRPVLTLIVSLSALSFACASDQKTANTPEEVPPADGTSSQPAGDSMPNGEPVNTPPSTPTAAPAPATTPQGSNDALKGNSLAAPGSASTQPAAPALTEAQVAKITDLANSSEIEQAKLAQGKAKSASVRKFAAMMIKHHGEAKAQQAKLYQSLQITPTQSQSATQLKDAGDRALGSLRAASGSAFDREYMETQVDAHQKVLDTLDQQLLPAAVDQALMDELKKMRATVESHLTEAKNVLDELDKSGAR